MSEARQRKQVPFFTPTATVVPPKPALHADERNTTQEKEEMQQTVRSSLLTEARSNYNGFINVGIILLFLGNFRLMWINYRKYGVLLSFRSFMSPDPSYWHLLRVLQSLLVFVFAAWAIEKLIAKGVPLVPMRILHGINIAASVCYPVYVIWEKEPSPGGATAVLILSSCVFMKITSWVVENARGRNRVLHKKKDEPADAPLAYPQNVTMLNMAYLLVAPTLRYTLNYPRTPTTNWKRVFRHTAELLGLVLFILLIVEQYIMPLLANAVLPFSHLDLSSIIERWLKLSVPNFYVWFLGFFCFFHLYLNILAELLKFGDRLFYRDWWNATTTDYFWKNWNIPTYHWLLNYIYFPLLARKYSKPFAAFCVFTVSAIFHELLVSVPFHSIKGLGFMSMFLQIPLGLITRPLKGSQIGNFIVWGSIILGQPLCVLLYYYDYVARHTGAV